MKPINLLLTILLLLPASLMADTTTADEDRVMQRYYELFSLPDKQEEFYAMGDQVKDIMMKRSGRHGYYIYRINAVTYEINMHRNSKALKMAREVLEEMKENGDNHFDMIYSTMAILFEDRGNYKMSRYYCEKAISAVAPKDTVGMIGAYLSMANLESSYHPDEAIRLVDHILPYCKKYPSHRNYAQTMKALAFYFKNDPAAFSEILDEYNITKRENNLQDELNDGIMQTIKAVFQNNNEEALRLINDKKLFSDNMAYYDMLIQLYKLKDNKDMVINMQQRKLAAIDSLNANIIYENMNEMNAEMEVNKAQRAVIKVRFYLLSAVIILLIVVLTLLVWRHLTRRSYRKKLQQQNKELEIALSRAEESDRMKDSFIEHVSHEIRTPLNVITGYAQIITNPRYHLTDEQRNRFINDINKNTTEITYIVNELLEVAQDESREYYQKDDTIAVNEFCKKLLQEAEKSNKQQLNLQFETALDDSYTLRSNSVILEKILSQLLNNAIKFTKEGRVELNVHESPDGGILRFIVTDTGIGIAEEHRERIFERFFKVDPFKQGFGLGLTMSRKMATLLGGSLNLDTTYTNGARFILTLSVNAESLA